MKIVRIEVEGHRGIRDRLSWEPADLTVVTGDAAETLAEAVFTLAQTPRGWSDLGEFFGALALPPRATPEGEESHTTLWRLTCAPGPDDDDRRHAEYEIGIYPPGDGLPWEVRYEALRRFDDFDEVEVLQREGATVTYKLTAPKRGPAPRRPTAREVVSRDMSALAVKTDLYEDPAVLPFARALALWSRYRRVDASPASPARAPSIFASFHERLWEGGGNLISALHNLTDIAHTRGPLEAALREAVPGHEALGFKALPDGTLALTHRLRGVDHRPPELPDEALRALCVVAALLSTAPPPLLWFEADFWDIPASMHGFAAECLVALSARARVVLVDPPEGLRAAVAAEVQRQRREGWRAESLHVADGPAGTTAEVRAFGGDAGVSPPR